jgi:3-deoxy-D-manno-octulosonate 8-phosphate phosphatase KdsC-like HAD superfamily phosphatase
VFDNKQGKTRREGRHGFVQRGLRREDCIRVLNQRVDLFIVAVIVIFEHVIEQIHFLDKTNERAIFADNWHLRDGVLVHHRYHLANRVTDRRGDQCLVRLGNQKVAMLTGDSRPVAESVAKELGIQRVFAEVLPEHKDEKVSELQKAGKRMAMVGDSVNDAPALTHADVEVAIESSGIVLVHSNQLDVVKIFKLSRASYRKMVQNLWWAAGYNIVAIPLAAGVLAGWGILLAPAVGAVLISVSTIVVAINAQLLRRTNL